MSSVISILFGPLLWLASFSAIYGLQGLSCELIWDEASLAGFSTARILLGIAWIAAIAAQVVLLLALHSMRFSPQSPFVRWVSRTTAWTGLVAAIWTLFPVAATTTCG